MANQALVAELPYWDWQCSVSCACHFGGYCTYDADEREAMLNASEAVPSLQVIDYVDPTVANAMANGKMNTADDILRANITSSIRRGHPQMRTGPLQSDRVCLVGSGPSLNDTLPELRQLVWEGAALVTLNGAYHWCLEHNLRPQTQIVMDARPSNVRFVQPEVPKCNYVLASQCAPAVWDAVEGRPHVRIFHPVVKQEGPTSDLLDVFYGGNWIGIGGGTTVASRAINLLRVAGYIRFDLFGVDCCWMGDVHHAVPQPENSHDAPSEIEVSVRGSSEVARFTVSPWHVKQLEDLCVISKVNGKHFQLEVHGRGLFAHVVKVLGESPVEDMVLMPVESPVLYGLDRIDE